MSSLRTFVALSAAALAAACAGPAPFNSSATTAGKAEEHASHHPEANAPVPMAATEARMKAMREMHDKVMSAKTPEERNALMADHMKAMQDGMGMMKGMSGMGGIGPMGGRGGMGVMADPKGMPADIAKRHQTMEQRMDMMQMMMEMMMDRLPPPPPAPAKK